jgi:hypothetical protein
MALWITTLLLTLRAVGHLMWLLASSSGADSKLALAAAPSGRIALHVHCAWQDHRIGWHWEGVARELTQVSVPRRIRLLVTRPEQAATPLGSASDGPETAS